MNNRFYLIEPVTYNRKWLTDGVIDSHNDAAHLFLGLFYSSRTHEHVKRYQPFRQKIRQSNKIQLTLLVLYIQ